MMQKPSKPSLPLCQDLNVPIAKEAAKSIAPQPRNATYRQPTALVNFAHQSDSTITLAIGLLKALNVDLHGLDEMDNRILSTIIDKFKGGPVGINTIATAVGEEPGTIEEVYEPFLIQEGYLMRTPRGREVTELAYRHLNKKIFPKQDRLF
jgi:Holliday junction DNA helicase RuvB